MAVRSIKPISPIIWIPPYTDAEFKIEIYSSGATYDITDDIIDGDYTDGITETIGNFTFTIDNTHQEYTDKFSLFDEIRVYSDYASEATTLRFKGVLEKISSRDEDFVITGRSISSKVLGILVTYSSEDYTHNILSSILTTYASYITQNNIDTSEDTDELITVNWYQKPFWECVLELCFRAGYDSYIDCDFDFNYFVSGSRENTTEAVVHDDNLIEVGDFASDLTNIKNKIVVYGSSIKGIPIFWTSKDSDSITNYKVREEIITDKSIVTLEQAKNRADYELSIKKDPLIIGEVTCGHLATILPGEKIRISDQVSGLYPTFYNIQKFTHKFGEEESTILTIQKEQSTISKILKKRITFESESTERDNPHNLDFSNVITFEEDSGTHDNTEINEGYLKVVLGQSSGQWKSDVYTLSDDVTEIAFKMTGDNLVRQYGATTSNLWYSFDGGTTWHILKYGATTDVPSGRDLRLRIDLNLSDAQVKAVAFQYSLS